jgi:hypothetical protein
LDKLVTACTVGPRYEEPDLPVAEHFDQATTEAAAEPAGSKLWSGFGSNELDAIITRALAANTTIAQAGARLNEARALSGLSVYSWFPTVTAGAGREKAQFSTEDPLAPGGIKTDTYRAGFDASWEIDLFGSLRNEYHAIDRRVEARTASLADAQLSIVAETAQAWFSLIGARERLALRRQQLANQRDNVRILTARFNAGSSERARPGAGRGQMRRASPPPCRSPRPTRARGTAPRRPHGLADRHAARKPVARNQAAGTAETGCDRVARRLDEATAGHPLRRTRAGGDLLRHRRRDGGVLSQDHAAGRLRLDRPVLGFHRRRRRRALELRPVDQRSFLDFGRVHRHIKAARRDATVSSPPTRRRC